MSVILPSTNTAVERLLVVNRHHPGNVHRMVRDETLPGGKPVNVARVLRALRTADDPADPWLVGLYGGPTGELFAAALAREDLPGEWVRGSADTRVCEVLVDLANPDGATVYNALGATVPGDEAARLDATVTAALPTAAALACVGSMAPGIPVTAYADWIEAAKNAGLLSLIDTTGGQLLEAAERGPTIVKINVDELHAASDGEPTELIDKWTAAGVTAVIITDGSRPSLALTPDGNLAVAPPRIDVVSAVGSGDAFTAGLLHSLLNGGDWIESLRRAAACGAANARHAASGVPDSADCLNRLAEHVDVTALTQSQSRRALSRRS